MQSIINRLEKEMAMTWEQSKQPTMGISPNCLNGPEEVDFARLCTALGATGLEDCKEILPDFATEIEAAYRYDASSSVADNEAA